MTTENVLKEVALILRGEHTGWGGDSILNAESYLHRFSNDMPEYAKNVAIDIDKNRRDASEISGLSSYRIQWIFNRIRESNKLMNLWADK